MKKIFIATNFIFISFLIHAQQPTVNYLLNNSGADSSGNSYHGTIYGANPSSDRASNATGALYFDGVNDYISVGTWPFLTQSNYFNNFSVSFWMKTDYTGLSSQSEVFGSINTPGAGMCFAVLLNGTISNSWSPGSIYFFLRDESAQSFTFTVSANDVFDNSWHCVTWVMKDLATHDATIYLDGVQRSYTVNTSQTLSNFVDFEYPFAIGAINNRGTVNNFYRGSLDEFRIYDFDLSSTQVSNNCNNLSLGENDFLKYVSSINLYPNPSNSILNIEVNNSKIKNMAVYNQLGQVVYNGNILPKLNLSDYSQGVYSIKFMDKDNNFITSKKVVVD